ncbi:MAG TPA: ATP-dependent 6-phosphofructokinase [Terriglobales bacterium]|nr:ATP-dependent 6-phosphofructokinase [Terriglobales bacterium]
MKRIAVLTSGGDAPGMNAAIRAVVRTGIDKGWEVVGVRGGYSGLVAGDYAQLRARDVGGIIQRGGTVLGSARCLDFHEIDTRKKALAHLAQWGIDGLVVIGGNGSQTGANALSEMGFPVVGVASTIDNDLLGSELTIGVDTALNIALEAIDRLKVTASSHRRGFLVEVMGRNCGYLALMAGIAGGAELVVVPEIEIAPPDVARVLGDAYKRGKQHAVAVVAEGATYDAEALVTYFKKHSAEIGFELRATILGHVQRGGQPTAFDRLLATRLGAGAVDALARGESGVVVGINQSKVTTTPLKDIVGKTKSIDPQLFELAKSLER